MPGPLIKVLWFSFRNVLRVPFMVYFNRRAHISKSEPILQKLGQRRFI